MNRGHKLVVIRRAVPSDAFPSRHCDGGEGPSDSGSFIRHIQQISTPSVRLVAFVMHKRRFSLTGGDAGCKRSFEGMCASCHMH